MEKDNKEFKLQNSISDYFALGEVVRYFFRKNNPDNKPSFNLKVMHGINKISILMFLVAVIVLIIRFFTRD